MIKELKEQIGIVDSNIKQLALTVRQSLIYIQDLIGNQAINLELLDENVKKDLYGVMGVIFDMAPLDVKKKFKLISFLNKRKVIDRKFLECVGILDCNTRHKNGGTYVPVKKNKTPLMLAGKLISHLRTANEKKNISKNERNIIKTMLNQIDNEL